MQRESFSGMERDSWDPLLEIRIEVEKLIASAIRVNKSASSSHYIATDRITRVTKIASETEHEAVLSASVIIVGRPNNLEPQFDHTFIAGSERKSTPQNSP